MFSYYGSKSKVVDLYPRPKFDKIIEPFAGSARYALKYFDRDVLLVDKYEVIVYNRRDVSDAERAVMAIKKVGGKRLMYKKPINK